MKSHYPRPRILDRIPRDRHAVIEASAGTGKTYTIEHMVVELLLRKQKSARLNEILILTFTERAAAELRRRIRSKIEEILLESCQEKQCHHDKRAGVWQIDDEARRRLTQSLFSFDSVTIGTIHGFFGRVLNEHAFTNRRLFTGTLEDGRTLFGRAFKTALRRSLARQPSDAALLLALWLERSQEGIDRLESILYKCHASRRLILPPFSAETFRRELNTNRLFEIDLAAAGDRFLAVIKAAGVKHAGTLKAIASRLTILAATIQASGPGWATAFDACFQESVGFLSERISKLDLGDDWPREIADAIIRLQGLLVSLKAAIVQTSLPIVRDALELHKAATGQFDYDDVISRVVAALDGPTGDELVRAMRERFRYALIDEFQDTDELQWRFFHRVFVESEERNLVYLIADPKQAIYGFRGADVATYIEARQEVERAGTPRVPLIENFRSTPAMIEAYNRILDASARTSFFDGPIQYDTPVKSGRAYVAEYADHLPSAPIHLLRVEPRNGEELATPELRRGLARQIAREVGDLLLEGSGLWFGPKDDTKRIEPGDIYVLTATNRDSHQIARALREAAVPFAFYKQEGLFQTEHAREVRDLLAAIDDPADLAKRGRAWITPFFAVPLAALTDLADVPDTHPLRTRLVDWNELAGKRRFERLFTRILDESGIIRRELFLKDDERALTNYLHIFEVLLEEARAAGCDLGDLVATLTAYSQETRQPSGEDGNVQRLESDRAAVQIMTIHRSKGLEAAVVFLYGGYGAFPSDGMYEYHQGKERLLYIGDNKDAKERAATERDEEEQRLYYVAITRAKARLYLPLVPSQLGGKQWKGSYRRLNDRLNELVSGLDGSGEDRLFKIIPFQDRPRDKKSDQIDQSVCSLASWQPPDELLKGDYNTGEFAGYRQRHAGYEVSSYSRMKRAWSGDLDPLERDEFRRDSSRELVTVAPTERALPGGTAAGLMLHEILEKIPFDLNANPKAKSLETWCSLHPVAEVIDAAMDRNGIEQVHRGEVEFMVYQALTFAVPLDQGRAIPGLCGCKRNLREMEFLFPFPEEFHPPFSSSTPGKLTIGRGFIKGFVDLVVEHDGQVYFGDWKSDVLPAYSAEILKKHVADHYELQARLYAVALVKALAIRAEDEYERSFGGLFYIFLRSLRPRATEAPEAGVYFDRPTWAQILSYEGELRRFATSQIGGRL